MFPLSWKTGAGSSRSRQRRLRRLSQTGSAREWTSWKPCPRMLWRWRGPTPCSKSFTIFTSWFGRGAFLYRNTRVPPKLLLIIFEPRLFTIYFVAYLLVDWGSLLLSADVWLKCMSSWLYARYDLQFVPILLHLEKFYDLFQPLVILNCWTLLWYSVVSLRLLYLSLL